MVLNLLSWTLIRLVFTVITISTGMPLAFKYEYEDSSFERTIKLMVSKWNDMIICYVMYVVFGNCVYGVWCTINERYDIVWTYVTVFKLINEDRMFSRNRGVGDVSSSVLLTGRGGAPAVAFFESKIGEQRTELLEKFRFSINLRWAKTVSKSVLRDWTEGQSFGEGFLR